jgi:O-antigen/teichoic acid export membrane protein
MPDTKRSESLRERVLKGGVYLTLRNGASMTLGFVGSLLVTRLIGPENYGLYMAAFGVFSYLSNAISPSVAAYLVREQSPDFLKHFHLAFWWLLGLGVIAAAVASGAVIAIAQFLGQSGDFQWILVSQFVLLPLALISAVPQALLERDLNYRPLAIVQLGSQTALYLAAVPLAWSGLGAWALVGGFWLSQTVQLAGYYAAARYRPRRYWSHANWKQMMHYSVSQSLSVWLYNLRDLAPSLILFPLAGERAVGYYALANRLINTLGFLYSVSGRVAFAAFARLQENKERLTKAIQETIQYLILFLGVVLTIFTASVGWVASWVLGAKWDASVIQQLCIVMASRVLLSSVFGVQTQALYVIGQNWLKFKANLAFAVSLIAVSGVLVGVAPLAYAPLVFALADHIAHIPTYWYDMYGVRKHIGRIDYRVILIWLAATQAAVFAPLVSNWLYLVTIGLLLHPASLISLRGVYKSLRRAQV